MEAAPPSPGEKKGDSMCSILLRKGCTSKTKPGATLVEALVALPSDAGSIPATSTKIFVCFK